MHLASRVLLFTACVACVQKSDGPTQVDDTSTCATPCTPTDSTPAPTVPTGDTGLPPLEPPGEWTAEDLRGPCDTSVRIGGFEVLHWDGSFGTVTGAIADGVLPNAVLSPKESDGDCQLFQQHNPFCHPPCELGEVCSHDEECIPFPANQDVGIVRAGGLAVPVTMEARASNLYWDTEVPYPLFEPGAPVWLETTGGDLAPVTLRGFGVSELDLESTAWNVVPGQDLEVRWAPPIETTSRIWIAVHLDQHGSSPVTLFCDTDDDGDHVLPAHLLEALVAYGVSGFASGTVRRRTVDHVTLDEGCVDLAVATDVMAEVDLEGHTPCKRDDDCPTGQTCDVPKQTCVDK